MSFKANRLEATHLRESNSIALDCLNCLVLIVAPNRESFDLYAGIGYRSDSARSTIKLLAGAGSHKISYSKENTAESEKGLYTITNGNTVNSADIYRVRLK